MVKFLHYKKKTNKKNPNKINFKNHYIMPNIGGGREADGQSRTTSISTL